ncbi:GtrA family protein [Paeniglutamicibacter sp. MACA_103]|uniref:GtrA family protein n=1 Tax=Paeniglutamicibacter sp. MACA_103 TaxID=3377337 RepID=UPI0038955C37
MLIQIWGKLMGLASMMWREVAKFGVVGGVAFIIDSGIYLWMLEGPMHDSEVKAKIIAGVVATMFSWVANRFWTFRHRRQSNVVRELVMFLIMNAIGLGIAAACVFITKYWIGLTDTTSLFIAGSVVGLVLGTIFRFFAYRFWVFGAELDAEEKFAHDRELLRVGPEPVSAERGAAEPNRSPDGAA